ncbi:hypothetical protein C8E87_1613 [Paractinoplanes brasiliensis]|uniref:Uncharacterized protein n=1 Tax=Paractinoplanes brasiliensis TaxID=52695 RepID=A0A4R6JNC5_9ACTN|nr:hypothetical protein C8E87_1613 [Actinoplanes brasiliensis]
MITTTRVVAIVESFQRTSTTPNAGGGDSCSSCPGPFAEHRGGFDLQPTPSTESHQAQVVNARPSRPPAGNPGHGSQSRSTRAGRCTMRTTRSSSPAILCPSVWPVQGVFGLPVSLICARLQPPRTAALPGRGTEMASYFSGESGHAGALQKDEDLRHGVRRSPVGRGLVTEHVHGQAGVEIELVEEEAVGGDCRDVVGLEGRLGKSLRLKVTMTSAALEYRRARSSSGRTPPGPHHSGGRR